MFSTKFIAAAAASFSLFQSSAAVYDPTSQQNLGMYWGSGFNQTNLRYFCDQPNVDIIPIGFINIFPPQGNGLVGETFGNQCYLGEYTGPGYKGVNNPSNNHLYTRCPNLQEDLYYCQQNTNKKILLSLGGAAGNYFLNGQADGVYLAEFLWGAYGPYNASWTGVRPLDRGLYNTDATKTIDFDGFDFDIEQASPDAQIGYIACINRLRQLFAEHKSVKPNSKTYLISGAPQCPLSEQYMSTAIAGAQFDVLWIQFYNNGQNGCTARNYVDSLAAKKPSGFNYDAWVTKVNAGKSAGAKLYLGLLAGQAGSDGSPNDFITANDIKTLVTQYHTHAQFGGVMLYEATVAENNGQFYNQVKAVLNAVAAPGTVTSTTTSKTSTSTSSTSTSSTKTSTTSSSTTTSKATTSSVSSTSSTSSTSKPTTSSTSSTSTSSSTTASSTSSTTSSSSTSSTLSSTSSSTSSISSSSSSSVSSTSSTSSSSVVSTSSTSSSSSSVVSPTSTTSSSSSTSSSSVVSPTSATVSSTSSSSSSSSSVLSTSSTSSSSDVSPTSTTVSSTSSSSSSSSVVSTTSVSTTSSSLSQTLTSTSSTVTPSITSSIFTNSSTIVSTSTTGPYTNTTSSTSKSVCTRKTTTSTSSPITTSTETTTSATGTLTPTTSGTSVTSTSTLIYTTSTVYTTNIYTITSCAPTVTNCPARIGSVTTETIALYTTVCPVTATETGKGYPTGTPIQSVPVSVTKYTTSTVYTTSVYTITSCPPSVTNCPAKIGSVTTETIALYTTVCPVTATETATLSFYLPGKGGYPVSSPAGDHKTTTLSSTTTAYITVQYIKSTATVVPIPMSSASASSLVSVVKPYPTASTVGVVGPVGSGTGVGKAVGATSSAAGVSTATPLPVGGLTTSGAGSLGVRGWSVVLALFAGVFVL